MLTRRTWRVAGKQIALMLLLQLLQGLSVLSNAADAVRQVRVLLLPTLTVLSTMALSQFTSICGWRSGSGGRGTASLAASPLA